MIRTHFLRRKCLKLPTNDETVAILSCSNFKCRSTDLVICLLFSRDIRYSSLAVHALRYYFKCWHMYQSDMSQKCNFVQFISSFFHAPIFTLFHNPRLRRLYPSPPRATSCVLVKLLFMIISIGSYESHRYG